MKYKKVLLAILIFVLISTMLAGCSFFGGDSSSESEKKSKSTITITLDLNGGKADKKTLLGTTGSPLDLPTPTREGYEFYGWCNDYLLFSEDTFPDTNMTLTARWYVKEEKTKMVTDGTPINKEYRFKYGQWLYFSSSSSSSSDKVALQKALEYFAHNSIDPIHLSVSYETYYNNSAFAISVGNVGYIKISGSNTGKVLYSKNITNIDGYEKFSFEGDIDPIELVPGNSENKYLHVLVDSNNSGYYMYIRNIKITITYKEEVGTIV